MELTSIYQNFGGAKYGMSTSAPNDQFPNRLYFANIGTHKKSTRRILVYINSDGKFKKIKDFLYDEDECGSIYQAELDKEEIIFLNGIQRKEIFRKSVFGME